MAVISISITDATEQIISGIPRSVSITANMPSTIFYTLDGTDPDTSSELYISAIYLPTDKLSVTLKIFATNGVDNSAIVSKTYKTTLSNNTRLSHAAVSGMPSTPVGSTLFPFGSAPGAQSSGTFKINSDAGITVDSVDAPNYPLGFDGDGNSIGGTDSSTPDTDYQFVYSTTDDIGQSYTGVGNLPSNTTVVGKNYPIEYTQTSSNKSDVLFNPKALVIFQDASKEAPGDPVHINRQYFSMENQEIVRDGSTLLNPGPENNLVTGSFLRNHYNPRTQEMTYYYYDNAVNRWIISKMPYQPKDDGAGALYSMVFSRPSNTSGFVFKWMPFRYRTLI